MKILNFLLPVVLLVIGVQFIRDYLGDTTKDEKTYLEQLISNGQETDGILDKNYEEKTIKIAGAKIKTYKVSYTFKVDEKEYSGIKSLKNPPTEPIIKVKYLPSNPSVNAVNPEEEIAEIEESQGTSTLLFGLALILAAIGLGYYRFSVYKKTKSA
jgi:hypothetical protein